jgi:autotransporter-associated beta strand protein
MTGTGGLTKSGSGALILSGNNSYSGGTTVSEGILAGDTNSLQGDIINNAVVFFEQANAGTYSGAMTGTGGLAKTGSGALILENSGNSLGSVAVLGGSLIVGGSAGSTAVLNAISDVHVYDSGLLGGHGSIGNNVYVHAGGALSPGNSYGTTHISGNLIFETDSFYEVEVDRNDIGINDKTVVDGSATLAGTVQHLETGGAAEDYADAAKEWNILTAGSLNGTFDNASSNLAFLTPQLRYDNNNVFMSFTTNSTTPAAFAYNYNQNSVFNALGSLDPNSDLYKSIMNTTTQNQAGRLLNELSGELHSTLLSNLSLLDQSFGRNLSRHISQASILRKQSPRASGNTTAVAAASDGAYTADNGQNVTDAYDNPVLPAENNAWVSMGASHASLDGSGGISDSSLYGPEVSGGYDADFVNNWLGGFAFRYSYKKLELDRQTEADINSYTAALYAGKAFAFSSGDLRIVLSGAYTRHEAETDRKISIGERNQQLEDEYSADSFLVNLEAAYNFQAADKLFLEPFANLGWNRLRAGSISEEGGSAALRKGAESRNLTTHIAGLRVAVPAHDRVNINAELGWQHTYGQLIPKRDFAFESGSNDFTITGNALSRNAAVVGLGASFKLKDNVSLKINYDGVMSDREQSHGGMATFVITF